MNPQPARTHQIKFFPCFAELVADNRRLGITVQRPEIDFALEKRRVVIAHTEELDLIFGDIVFGQQGAHDGFVIAAVGDADGLALKILGCFQHRPVRPVNPMQWIDLKKLGQYDDRRSLGNCPDDLICRCHAELSMTDFKLFDGILFRASRFDVYFQAVSFEITLGICPQITDNTDIIQPFEPIIYLLQRMLFFAASCEENEYKHCQDQD